MVVAVSDSVSTLHDPSGLDLEALAALKRSGGALAEHGRGVKLARDAVIAVASDASRQAGGRKRRFVRARVKQLRLEDVTSRADIDHAGHARRRRARK